MSALTPLISRRWSPYAFCPKTRVEPEKLMSCFEAARWAPSSYNEQPWHYVYADKFDHPEEHSKLVSFMVDFNQSWAKFAPVIAIVSAHKQSDLFNKPNPHAEYDCGASTAFFTVQAMQLGLQVHQMAGFDCIRASNELDLPPGYTALTIFAVGYAARNPNFLNEALQERHEKQKTRIRKDIESVVTLAKVKP
jgi:nitroreductase